MKYKIILGLILLSSLTAFSQDKNFYIYLCFGQSNMEGAARPEPQDSIVDDRFWVMQSVDCPDLGRIKGNWYTAVPPLCRCRSGLSPPITLGGQWLPISPKMSGLELSMFRLGAAKLNFSIRITTSLMLLQLQDG